MLTFCKQIEKANTEGKNIIIQGDANMCSTKWREADFNLSYIGDELISTLAMCGLEPVDVGMTYQADMKFWGSTG